MSINENFPAASFPLAGTEKLLAANVLSAGRQPQDENISVDQIAGHARGVVALTDAASIVNDAAALNKGVGSVTLGGNRTLANPTNLQPGQKWDIIVIQDGTGNRTLAYGTAYKKVGGTVTLTTTAGAIDILHLITDGTTVFVTIDKAFA